MKKSVLLLMVFCITMLITSCSTPDKTIISKYFQAMEANDRETMQSMSADPKDLEFKSYEIVSVTEQVREKAPKMLKE